MVSSPEASLLLVVGGRVLGLDGSFDVRDGAAVAIADGRVVAVDDDAMLREAHPQAATLDATGAVVLPGLVNTHQHLTGDPLVRSCIPDQIDADTSIFDWAVPIHGVHDEGDDHLAATVESLRLLKSGVTTVVEAGTVAHPYAVADAMSGVGIRGTLGMWGWDEPDVPHRREVADYVGAMRDLSSAYPRGGKIEAMVTLVGHTLASDELFVAASDLARELGVGLTLHVSPSEGDTVGYASRSGRAPIEHLASLGVLGPHLLLAHAVWTTDAELDLLLEHDVAIASCPWAYLRLAQGLTVAGRHGEFAERGGRLSLGSDACNASDHHSLLSAAALLAGIERDRRRDPSRFGAHWGLELATAGGADAIGHGADLGRLAPGVLADLIVVEANGIEWSPAGDVVSQLVWGAPDRRVRHVVVGGDVVIRDGRSTRFDEVALSDEVAARQRSLLARAGLDPDARPVPPLRPNRSFPAKDSHDHR